jgi:hypothetical protein
MHIVLAAITGIAAAEDLPFVEAAKRCGVKGIALNIKVCGRNAGRS